MVISNNLENYFKDKQPDSIVSAEEAVAYLKKFDFPEEVSNKVAEIITWKNKNDVSNPKVTTAINQLWHKVELLDRKKQKQIEENYVDLAA